MVFRILVWRSLWPLSFGFFRCETSWSSGLFGSVASLIQILKPIKTIRGPGDQMGMDMRYWPNPKGTQANNRGQEVILEGSIEGVTFEACHVVCAWVCGVLVLICDIFEYIGEWWDERWGRVGWKNLFLDLRQNRERQSESTYMSNRFKLNVKFNWLVTFAYEHFCDCYIAQLVAQLRCANQHILGISRSDVTSAKSALNWGALDHIWFEGCYTMLWSPFLRIAMRSMWSW